MKATREPVKPSQGATREPVKTASYGTALTKGIKRIQKKRSENSGKA